MFAKLVERGDAPIIVEVGCVRDRGNWQGDDQSTVMFQRFVTSFGGSLYSVDHSPAAVELARSVGAVASLGDSVAFLAAFVGSIDLLYLDGADEPENSLMELAAASKNLRRGSIVMVDDTLISGGRLVGKGVLVDTYMRRIGAPMITEGYQRAWMM